jgi:hypothetical protein
MGKTFLTGFFKFLVLEMYRLTRATSLDLPLLLRLSGCTGSSLCPRDLGVLRGSKPASMERIKGVSKPACPSIGLLMLLAN